MVAFDLIWVWVSDTSFLREEVCGCCQKEKSVFAEYREVDLGGFLLSDGLFLL